MPVLVLSLGKVELVVGDTDWNMGQNLRNTKKLAGYGMVLPWVKLIHSANLFSGSVICHVV